MRFTCLKLVALLLTVGMLAGCGSDIPQGEPPTPEHKAALEQMTLKALDSPLALDRIMSVQAIGNFDPESASQAIPKIEALQKSDPDPQVRQAATEALARLRGQ